MHNTRPVNRCRPKRHVYQIPRDEGFLFNTGRAVIRFQGRSAGEGKILTFKRPLKDLPRLEKLISQSSWKYSRQVEFMSSVFEDITRKMWFANNAVSLKAPSGEPCEVNQRRPNSSVSSSALEGRAARPRSTCLLPLKDPGRSARKNPRCQLQHPSQRGRHVEQLSPESPTSPRGSDRCS